MSETDGRYFVAIVGGAVSGSVAAEQLSEDGVEVVVIEQHERPYGKIEDGLPRWHAAQRRREYDKIGARLTHAGVHFVPCTRLGKDVNFDDLAKNLGFSAVLLATGAWRDRPFPIDGADDYIGKGLLYQNALIHWFNHKNQSEFEGEQFDIPDRVAVFGGGLASIDVMKVCQLVNFQRALHERGIHVLTHEIEKKGIDKVCAAHGINDPDELGVEGCTLFYRRRIADMPLAQPPLDATPEQIEKTILARGKLLSIVQEKLRFNVRECTMPIGLEINDDRIVGIKLQKTNVTDGRAVPVEGSEETYPTDLIISSIGSLPEPISGIPMEGNKYSYQDWEHGKLAGYDGVFGIGNVVAGKGNIRASLQHAEMVVQYLRQNYFRGAIGAASAEAVRQHLEACEPLSPEKLEALRAEVRSWQERVGYDGNYEQWIKKHTPPDLE